MIGKRGERIGANAQIQRVNNIWRKGTLRDPSVLKKAGDNGMFSFNRPATPAFVDYRNIDFENNAAIARTEEPIDRFREGNMGLMSRTRSRSANLGILRQGTDIKAMAPEIEGMGDMQLTSGIRNTAPEIGIMQATSGLRASAPEIGQFYDIGMGQGGDANVELFNRDLHALSKRVKRFNATPLIGTSAAEERAVYQSLKALMQKGKTFLTGVYGQVPPMVDSELGRWFMTRQYALTGKGTNRVGIGKVRERMLGNLNKARITMGLAPIAVMQPATISPELIDAMARQEKETAAAPPGMQTAPALPAQIAAPGMSKGTMIAIGVGIAAVAAYMYFKK